jgi:lipoprotein-anchoring transpeptidase ErfK/SrfK
MAVGAQSGRAQGTETATAPEQTVEQKSDTAPEQKKSEQVSEPATEQQQAVEQQHATEQKSQAAAAQSPPAPAPASKVDLSGYAAGTIVVETSERKLHLVLENGESLTYPVGVGKAGKSWSGTGAISGKFLQPAWSPPRRLKMEKPWTPNYIPGGSPSNPMGAAAMTLNVDQYAIHGTNAPSSIGGFVSFGCIRMHNKDILDLYKRVKVGTKVVVLQ